MDERQRLFEVWAPPAATFSAWAKPVLFAQMDPRPVGHQAGEPIATPAPWMEALDGRTAVVLDLPGVESVWCAAALARRGYRPVPLFNGGAGPNAAVQVEPVMLALQRAGPLVAEARIPDEAPPVFMLDSDRLGAGRSPAPGSYDNRWVVLPQDFPSGRLLRSRGIERALVVRDGRRKLGDDLAGVLARWKKDGVELSCTSGAGERVETLAAPAGWRPAPLLALALVSMGLRRNSAGGFGGRVPVPPQSSGGGFG